MAEIILSVVTKSVLSHAISLASQEIRRVWGVGKDLENLAGKIERIEAFLSDAGHKEPNSRAVQIWLRDVETVAKEANILLDLIAYEGLRKTIEKKMLLKVRIYFSSSNPVVFRFRVAREIKKINLALDDVYKEATVLRLLPNTNGIISSDIKPQLTPPYLDDSQIVGRTDEMEKIVSELTCSSEGSDFPVIGIVGMGGQGKTTLAQLIYKNGMVTSYFDKRIWVCVSDHFNSVNILNEMLQSLTGTNFGLTNMEAIVEKLKAELSGKNFLLVLDDVWNGEQSLWASLMICLREVGVGGSKRSKMIVTTRSEKVISAVDGKPYHLGFLTEEDSRTLFEKIAFAVGGAPKTNKLVDIGCKIVERCGGIPLAIKAMGGLLSSKKYESEWLEVEGSKTWILLDALSRVHSAIKLSYDHLPLSIKQCFAICSIYNKDSVMKKEELVQLWMAQGLLNPPRGSHWDMESIGNSYFETLLQRSFFHDAEVNDYGLIVSCKMHDLVHDFAVQVSKSYCLNLEDGLWDNDIDIKATHLSISSGENEKLKLPKRGLQNLRTLVVNDGIFGFIQLIDYKYLHVLVVADWGVIELPTSIRKLKHLRYLDISRTNIEKLPEEITKLYQLQTLRANNLSELPDDLGNLLNLRHIYGYEGSCLLSQIRNLTSLRTLPDIELDKDNKCKMEELGGLQHLAGEVKIFGLENVPNQDEAMKAKLSEKENIDLLELRWNDRSTGEECNDEKVLEGLKPHSTLRVLSIVGFAGQNLPSWMVFLHKLVKIEFEFLENCKHIPPLGHLPYLKFLTIRWMKSLKRIGSEFYGISILENATGSSQTAVVAFPSLKSLMFYNISEWEHWCDPEQEQHRSSSSYGVKLFPNLEELKIVDCPKLIGVPKLVSNIHNLVEIEFGGLENCKHIPPLGHLPYLKFLAIERMNSLKRIGSEFYGISILENATGSSQSAVVAFPSLKRLQFHGISKWKQWCDPEQAQHRSSSSYGVKLFPNLETLSIFCCRKLIGVPKLVSNISSLKHLFISGCDYEMVSLPDIGGLVSLQCLDILSCNFSALPRGLKKCTSLWSLSLSLNDVSSVQSLRSLPNLVLLSVRLSPNLDTECFPRPGIKNTAYGHRPGIKNTAYGHSFGALEFLKLEGNSKVKFLPDQIQHLPALRDLRLKNFEGLEALPEWLGNIHSLRCLELRTCPNITRLPYMKNLTRLWISDSPTLSEVCGVGGSERHKIAHIPHIVL